MVDMITSCPICSKKLTVERLSCSNCDTVIENKFELPKLLQLEKEKLHFAVVFLQCRGNIKDVERVLGISYPTVRAKLDDVVNELNLIFPVSKVVSEVSEKVGEILRSIENGTMSVEKALKNLQGK